MGFTVENRREKARYFDDEWKKEKNKYWKIPVAVNNFNFIERIIYVLLGVMPFFFPIDFNKDRNCAIHFE